MSKMIFFDLEARNKMKKGVDTLANAVKVTLDQKVVMLLLKRNSDHLLLLRMVFLLQKKLT